MCSYGVVTVNLCNIYRYRYMDIYLYLYVYYIYLNVNKTCALCKLRPVIFCKYLTSCLFLRDCMMLTLNITAAIFVLVSHFYIYNICLCFYSFCIIPILINNLTSRTVELSTSAGLFSSAFWGDFAGKRASGKTMCLRNIFFYQWGQQFGEREKRPESG